MRTQPTPGFNHREAYALMKYATDDGSEVEWLWNSRDGVTPFVISSRSGKPMTHVDWHLDTRLPASFLPPAGMRVFVDLTPEAARAAAERNVDYMWAYETGYTPALGRHIRDVYPSKEAAVDALMRGALAHAGAPMIVEYGEVDQ